MDTNKTNNELVNTDKGKLLVEDVEYVRLVSLISDLWENAKAKAAIAVNAELLDANWQTGCYIVEFEQGGNAKAKYGDSLLVNLSKDLTRMKGKGFSRSNLVYMRKLYLTFPKSETLSHQLTWSHYFELPKCDDSMEMQFYMKGKIGLNIDNLDKKLNNYGNTERTLHHHEIAQGYESPCR